MASDSWKTDPTPKLDSSVFGASEEEVVGRHLEATSTGSPASSHARLSATPPPKGLQNLDVWWNAVNLDFNPATEQMGFKIFVWRRQKYGVELGLIWVHLVKAHKQP